MDNEEVLKERARIKEFTERKLDSIIKFRIENIRHKDRRNISLLENIKHYLIFKIDNPDYVRIGDRETQTT